MNNITLEIQQLEESLDRLSGRMPEMPRSSVLLSRLLLHVGRGISAMLEHQIRPFGLNEAEFRVLTLLFSQIDGSANPTDLCAKAAQSPANMSRISDALVARGLISRVSSATDRRKMVLRMTERGEELVRSLLPKLYGPLREIFRDFSADQQSALTAQLRLLAGKLDDSPMHEADRSAEDPGGRVDDAGEAAQNPGGPT